MSCVISAQRPRSAAVGECADEVRAEPDAHRLLQRVVSWFDVLRRKYSFHLGTQVGRDLERSRRSRGRSPTMPATLARPC